MQKRLVPVLLAVTVLTVAALVLGADFLLLRLPGGLPLGNLITVFGLVTGAAAALLLSRAGSLLRGVALAALVAAVVWFPLSAALAGNVDLEFSGSRGTIWLWLTLLTGLLVLTALVGALVQAARKRTPKKGRPEQAA